MEIGTPIVVSCVTIGNGTRHGPPDPFLPSGHGRDDHRPWNVGHIAKGAMLGVIFESFVKESNEG